MAKYTVILVYQNIDKICLQSSIFNVIVKMSLNICSF